MVQINILKISKIDQSIKNRYVCIKENNGIIVCIIFKWNNKSELQVSYDDNYF